MFCVQHYFIFFSCCVPVLESLSSDEHIDTEWPPAAAAWLRLQATPLLPARRRPLWRSGAERPVRHPHLLARTCGFVPQLVRLVSSRPPSFCVAFFSLFDGATPLDPTFTNERAWTSSSSPESPPISCRLPFPQHSEQQNQSERSFSEKKNQAKQVWRQRRRRNGFI